MQGAQPAFALRCGVRQILDREPYSSSFPTFTTFNLNCLNHSH
jgi:hypothetical protein